MMRRLLCRVGAHKWRAPYFGHWTKYEDGGRTHVRGVQTCERHGCPAVRDYHNTWTPKIDVVGPTRKIR